MKGVLLSFSSAIDFFQIIKNMLNLREMLTFTVNLSNSEK